MGLLEIIRQAGNGECETLYECRNCGGTVDSDADECIECGSVEIACYTFQ